MAAETSSGGGIAIIVICSILLGINFACLVYCFLRRNYLPLRACNVTNMNMTYISMVMTFVGSINISGFSGNSKQWSVCAVTLGWLGMALGALAFISLFQMRVYTYLNIFVSKRRATGLYFIIPVAYMLMISIAYAIAAFILPPKTGFMYIPETNVCFTNDPVYFAGMGLIILQAVLLGGLLLKTLKMECCFNERRNAILGFIICVICGIVVLALGRIHFSNDKLALSGILKILFAVVPQQGYFYLNLGPTIYHMVTHADEYNQRFIGVIEEKGLAHVYELACKSPLGAISSMRVNEEGKPRDINMAESDNGSEYSDSSNFSGNVPGPEHANQSQPPTYSGVRRSGSVSGHYT